MEEAPKQSILKKLIPILLAMVISFLFMQAFTLPVYAEDYDFDEGDPSVAGTKGYEGGPSWSRSGVIFYLVDENGGYAGVKPIFYTTSHEGFVDRNKNPISPKNDRIMPRLILLKYDRIKTGAIDLWGPPWGSNGELRGVEIREWLTTIDDDGHSRATKLINDEWGEDYAIRYENKELYLVFEAVGWNNLFMDGINTGICLAGASRFWPYYYKFLDGSGKFPNESGDPTINLYTHDKYQHCMLLNGEPEVLKMGLNETPTRSGKQTNDTLMDYMNGWGMGVLWNEPNAINTYDPEAGSPGPAEDPKKDFTKAGTKNIVKGYYTENEDTGEKTSDGVFIQYDVSKLINIMDEPEYQVVQWDMSEKDPVKPDPTNWNPPVFNASYANGEEPGTVELPTHAKTLYVLLKKVVAEDKESNDDWVIEESEITKSVETGSKISNDTIGVTFPNLETCNGHSRSREVSTGCSSSCTPDCPGGHTTTDWYTEYCDSWSLVDKHVSLTTRNLNEDDKTTSRHVLAKDSNFEVKHEKNPYTDTRDSTGEQTKDTKGYNYKFVLHRFNKDKLGLLNYESSPGDIGKIAALGTQYNIQKVDAKPRKTRKTEEYMEELKILLDLDIGKSGDLETSASGDEDCHNTGSITRSNNQLEFTGDVTIKTYSGQAKDPDGSINTSDMMTIGNSTTSGRMMQSGGSVTFQPFIQMTYQTLDSPKEDVYVISEWTRQIIPNDYAEISWGKKAENLRLTSNQWSTHADSLRLSTDILGQPKSNCMLPGGAVYSLDMKNSSGKVQPQIVTLKTYQTIIEGKARQYSNLASDSSTMTDAEAQAEHQAFVDGAAGALDTTLVEMWVNPDPKASTAWSSGGIKVGPGTDISALNNGSATSSSDSKYYLSPDTDNNTNASRSDLDVKITDSADVYHRIWSDTKGNIRYAKGNSVSSVTGVPIDGGSVVLTKGQDTNNLSGELKNIDTRTKAVTKYVAAVERNTGNDPTASWATDGKWYNEAYYGIIVVEQTSKIEVKFHATDVRTTVLDPKLVPKITKKTEPLEAFLFQYKTALPSKAPLSTFKGKAIYMNNADLLFHSQKAYIISQTVQDLS